MDPQSVSVTIDRPREEVFAYLADIAHHPEFTDHFLVDWRLTREDSVGRGAGARYRVKAPLNRYAWADSTFVEVDAPRRIVEAGHTGKFNRVVTSGLYELEADDKGATRVSWTRATRPKTPADRLLESLGARAFYKRADTKALRRLRTILEEDRGRGVRATIAGR